MPLTRCVPAGMTVGDFVLINTYMLQVVRRAPTELAFGRLPIKGRLISGFESLGSFSKSKLVPGR